MRGGSHLLNTAWRGLAVWMAALNRATVWTRDRHFESIATVLEQLDVRLLDD